MSADVLPTLPFSLEAASWRSIQGYAETQTAKCLVVYPRSVEDCQKVLEQCEQQGRLICCRGGGYSYGDMILNAGQVVLDISQMNQILQWNPAQVIFFVQPGGGFVSRELFVDILESEEEHIDWLETQLELIDKVGMKNYLQSKMGS